MNRMSPTNKTITLLAALLASLVMYSAWIEPQQVVVTHREIREPALYSVLGNKVVVQLSDLHINAIGRRETTVLTLIKKINPDIIMLTGDYVSWGGNYQPALDFLSRLRANIGIWGVLGDSDLSNSRFSCLFCHNKGSTSITSQNKIRFLDNSCEEVFPGRRSMIICGFNDGISEEPNRQKLQNLSSQGLPILLLAHNPLVFNRLDPNQGLAMLAGDTHGGQIPLPSFVWQVLGYTKTAVYPYGLFKNGRNILSVSSGIGTSHIPFRFMRKPEIVVYRFSGSDGGNRNSEMDRNMAQ